MASRIYDSILSPSLPEMLKNPRLSSTLTSLLIPLITSSFISQPAFAQEQSIEEKGWSEFPFEAQFVQGCVQGNNVGAEAFEKKQQYCHCAFETYESRYTPIEFMQINALAVDLGENGPHLVSLMLKPELEQCSTDSGYQP